MAWDRRSAVHVARDSVVRVAWDPAVYAAGVSEVSSVSGQGLGGARGLGPAVGHVRGCCSPRAGRLSRAAAPGLSDSIA